MKRYLIIMLCITTILGGVRELQKAAQKREVIRVHSLCKEVRLIASGTPPPKPTATPPHDTMHVTQKLNGPGDPDKILGLLAKNK